MALRTIRVQGDSVLTKKSRTVDKMTPRIGELITDMLDTMYDAMGVGLAAPQVGILKRIVVIDVGEGPIVLINPEILETSGEQTGDEGCLSVPGMAGQVTRPNYVKVKALDVNMEEQILEGEGLLARAFCHEIDHLDGKMYTELVEGGVLTPMQMAERMSFAPARILGLENKGSVSEGKTADLVVFDPSREYEIDTDTFLSKGKNTPFDGWKVKGDVKYTLVDGKLVYKNKAYEEQE